MNKTCTQHQIKMSIRYWAQKCHQPFSKFSMGRNEKAHFVSKICSRIFPITTAFTSTSNQYVERIKYSTIHIEKKRKKKRRKSMGERVR